MGAKEVGRPSSPGIGICVVLYIHLRTGVGGVASRLEGVYLTLASTVKLHHRIVHYSTYPNRAPLIITAITPKIQREKYCSADGDPPYYRLL